MNKTTDPKNDTLNLALIYGSTREGRFCDVVAHWAEEQVKQRGEFKLDSVDPAKLDLPSRIESEDGPAVTSLSERLGKADAFVVVTPEYNHSIPSALKFVIDSVSEPWLAKPVGFVSYGGISGGLRAVEHLRHVFAELHAVTMRDSVSFASAWEQFDDNGKLKEPERAQRAMKRTLDQLVWWARALRDAKTATEYPG